MDEIYSIDDRFIHAVFQIKFIKKLSDRTMDLIDNE